MKAIFKEKLLWIGVLCLVIAIGFGVADTLLHPTNSYASAVDKALNGNYKALAACSSTEEYDEIVEAAEYISTISSYLGLLNVNITVIGGDERSCNYDGYNGMIEAFILYTYGDSEAYFDTLTIYTIEEDGKTVIGGLY